MKKKLAGFIISPYVLAVLWGILTQDQEDKWCLANFCLSSWETEGKSEKKKDLTDHSVTVY